LGVGGKGKKAEFPQLSLDKAAGGVAQLNCASTRLVIVISQRVKGLRKCMRWTSLLLLFVECSWFANPRRTEPSIMFSC
jgi:hypothetical protein